MLQERMIIMKEEVSEQTRQNIALQEQPQQVEITSEQSQMVDIQSQEDTRGVALDRAGVSGVKYPVLVRDRSKSTQHTVATLAMSVSVPQHFKGTHMSRFIEVLKDHHNEIAMETLPTILHNLRERLDALSARIELHFPYFMTRKAPASGATALMDFECSFKGEVSKDHNGQETQDCVIGIRVPVTSLCPCSKAISDYGAHNQRGYITIEVRSTNDQDGNQHMIWLEELVEIAERSASSPVYPLLKRSDERYVTMEAYDNPVFVEDMVRNTAVLLKADKRVAWFRVHAVNQESIHNHDAFAEVSWKR